MIQTIANENNRKGLSRINDLFAWGSELERFLHMFTILKLNTMISDFFRVNNLATDNF